MHIQVLNSSLQMLAPHILKIDIQAVRREPLQRVPGPLLLVVERAIEAGLVDDEVELLVAPDGADDSQALALGDLAGDLADGAGGRADEDGLALLEVADLVQRRVGRQARHAERAQEHLGRQPERVVEPRGLGGLLGRQRRVLRERQVRVQEVARGVGGGAVGAQHPRDGVVVGRFVELVRRRVRLDVRLAHPEPQVRV